MTIKHRIRSSEGDGSLREIDLIPTRAVRCFCSECVGWELARIRGCGGDTGGCPLFPFRNENKPRGSGSILRAINSHCLECMGGRRREVRECPDEVCSFFPYRLGKNPLLKGRKVASVSIEALRLAHLARISGHNSQIFPALYNDMGDAKGTEKVTRKMRSEMTQD